MIKMMKTAVCGLALVASLGLGMVAEAGSIPTNKVPLHTYAVRKINTYQQIGGAAKGWIDPGDYVIVTQIRGDGWAYGSYPVGNKRVSRWFKANDLVNNVGFSNQEKTSPQEKITVYRESSYRTSLGSVWGKEPITVVSNAGDSRQIIYKISGGYKMGWIPSRYIPDPIPPIPNNNAVINRMRYLSQSVNGFKPNTKYTGSGQCRGFANKVYTTLFNVFSITGYSSNNYAATSYNSSRVAGKLYNHANNNASAVQNLFRYAKPGSFIQMGRRYSLNSTKTAPNPHSAILYSVSNTGCEFYEANADNKNTIKINFYSWATLADKNKGFTIYEPNTYRLK